jgi:hypothetical protein
VGGEGSRAVAGVHVDQRDVVGAHADRHHTSGQPARDVSQETGMGVDQHDPGEVAVAGDAVEHAVVVEWDRPEREPEPLRRRDLGGDAHDAVEVGARIHPGDAVRSDGGDQDPGPATGGQRAGRRVGDVAQLVGDP